MAVGMAEWLAKVGNLKRTQEKIAALRENDSLILRAVLQVAYDPDVKFALPEGAPPYTPSRQLDDQSVFIKNGVQQFRYFLPNFYPGMNQGKREQLFIQFLEAIDPKDAELVCHIKEKNPIKGFTLACVTEAFPDLIPSLSQKA
jgi:hypothetical protein